MPGPSVPIRTHPIAGPPHPTYVEADTDPATFIQQSLQTWQSFAAEPPEGVTVLESSWFQQTVLPLLWNDVEPAVIEQYVAAREAAVQKLQPALLYFV